jgi:hypothetical protein
VTGTCDTFTIAGKAGACDNWMRLVIDDNNGPQFISSYQLPGAPWTTFSLIGNQKTPEVDFATFLADGIDGAFPASGVCNANLFESKISMSCSVRVTVSMSMAPIALEWKFSGSRDTMSKCGPISSLRITLADNYTANANAPSSSRRRASCPSTNLRSGKPAPSRHRRRRVKLSQRSAVPSWIFRCPTAHSKRKWRSE